MERRIITPRQGWQDLVEHLGFYFHTIDNEIYWDESAYYYFTAEQMGVFAELCHFKNHLPNFSLSGK